MPEIFIPLEAVAQYENIDYHTLLMRIKRNPQAFKTKLEPRKNGKPRTLVAVSSLSTRARRLYRAQQKQQELQGEKVVIESIKDKKSHWYVETDEHWYMDNYPGQYERGQALAELMRELTDYCGDDRTGYTIQFAAAHGMTTRSLYRLSKAYLDASALALEYERETGRSHDYFKVLALCRKPKGSNRFPSIDPEVKALIENEWFSEKFRKNDGTIQGLYEKLSKKCEESSVPYPSYQTVARYINYLMKEKNGHSQAYLAKKGAIDWKNKYMFKCERDLKSLAVMEIVVGDVHTFDLFVKYTPPNGKPIAIRPKLVAWIDMRSRSFFSFAMCKESNTSIVKNSFAKGVRTHGAPQCVLVDNGKDFANQETLGHNRKERLILDDESAGFFKDIGVQAVFRSLPFQPWDKIIERAFGTACQKFSKQFDSYEGTLTGSRTDAKVHKDIKGMLARDELFTLEEFYALWEKWVAETYDVRKHRGLKDAGEEFITPRSLFENAEERYFKPAPPDSYIAMLLMQSKRVPVGSTGIRHDKQLYMCADLLPYVQGYVKIRWNPDDPSVIYAFTEAGELIGEIPQAVKLNASFYADEEQVEAHKRMQNRHLQMQREALEAYRLPFDQRPENADATPRIVGGLELTLGKKPRHNVVSMPEKEPLAEAVGQQSRPAKKADIAYYDKLGQEVFDKLKDLK